MPMVKLLFASLLFLAFISASRAAEIININYKYKIAFTDMTDSDVRAGDSVVVALPDGKMGRLKVLETFPVMAKLTLADGAGALTPEQFSSIIVGSAVTLPEASRRSHVPVKKTKVDEDSSTAHADVPPGIEAYVPGAAKEANASTMKTMERRADEGAVARSEAPVDNSGKNISREEALERRLDQMMNNNVKLADTLAQLLAAKNEAEALAKAKEADTLAARKKANDLADANALLEGRVSSLTASVDALKQDKLSQQKEIEALNLRLGELKKKLAKMVDIVNTNMKAYEKQ